jgi:hypothetical protein
MDTNTKKNGSLDDGLAGFGGDSDGDRLIKGTKIKFTTDAVWMAGDDAIDKDREFLAIRAIKAVQKWLGGRPVETQILQMDEKPVPKTEALNNAAPREEWRDKFGKSVGPWEWCYAVYFLDPVTMQIFTWTTNTVGGGQAVRELRESVGMARRMHGDNVYPRVRLTDTFMPTNYGGRQRPQLGIVSYEEIGAPAALPVEEAKQIEAPKPAEEPPEQKAKAAVPPKTLKTPKGLRY